MPSVVIIGAGIGGLCLAQGLRKAGIPVQVYERDERPGSRWEGYRIAINADGAAALHACLPDPLWRAFLATSGPGGPFGLHHAHDRIPMDVDTRPEPEEPYFAVDRAILRRLLLAGLDDVVHFGARFARYRVEGEQVIAEFADGRSTAGDVLVGADGTASPVRRQYLPHARVDDAGVGGVADKLFLTDAVRAWLPRPLQTGMNLITDGAGVALFTSVYAPPAGARAALETATGPQPNIGFTPYLLCALNADVARLPDDLTRREGPDLRAVVDDLTAGWHPTLRRLLAEADPASRSGVRFSVATPTPRWPTTRVTLLGDAIHTMPATGGRGGNTALYDARALTAALMAAARGERPLLTAIGAYEEQMRGYGWGAVRETLLIRDRMLGRTPARTSR
jgi:2-polyprenyl-6-methoxyphenol hydroxylase-like FAD-dependent oxidoreductase